MYSTQPTHNLRKQLVRCDVLCDRKDRARVTYSLVDAAGCTVQECDSCHRTSL